MVHEHHLSSLRRLLDPDSARRLTPPARKGICDCLRCKRQGLTLHPEPRRRTCIIRSAISPSSLYKTSRCQRDPSWRRVCTRARTRTSAALRLSSLRQRRAAACSATAITSANHVHHFDIPGQHGQLVIVAESLVEMSSPPFPHTRPSLHGRRRGQELDRAGRTKATSGRCCCPAEFTASTPAARRACRCHFDVRTPRRSP